MSPGRKNSQVLAATLVHNRLQNWSWLQRDFSGRTPGIVSRFSYLAPMWLGMQARVIAVCAHNAFQRGDRDDFANAKSRGSPFQLPTRLAVGLGLESGLETGCPVSFAPSSSCLEDFGSPASGFRKEARLRLQRRKLIIAAAVCQSVSKLTLARANGNGVNT